MTIVRRRFGHAFLAGFAFAIFGGGASAQIVPTPDEWLNTNATADTGDDATPQVATDGAGNWVAVWYSTEDLGSTAGTDADIFVATSTDNGATWSAPALLNTNGTTDAGLDWIPQVTTDGAGNWVAVWQSDEDLGTTAGTDGDIFVATSTNNGASWSAPALLNTNGTSDTGNDTVPQVTTDGVGNWIAVWYSDENLGGTAGTDLDIFVATSTNSGASWSAPTLLNSNGTSDTGDDSDAQVTTDGAGNWVAAWRSTENLGGTAGTDADNFVATSTNSGASWSTPALLNSNGTSDSADDDFVQVTTDGTGNWIAVWQSTENLGGTVGMDYDLFFARSTDDGASWSAPALFNSNGTTDDPLFGDDTDVQVTTDGLGYWVAVWYSSDDLGATADTDGDIFVATSVNNGATWSAPAVFNTSGTSDTGVDYTPQVTTDGSGNWVVVWGSNENLGGTAGTDGDIFVGTFSFGGSPLPASAGAGLAVLAVVLSLLAAIVYRRYSSS